MTPDQTEYTVLPSCLASDRRLDDLDREEGLESACEKANAHVGLPKLKLAHLLCLSEQKKRLKQLQPGQRVCLCLHPDHPKNPGDLYSRRRKREAEMMQVGKNLDHFTVFSRSFSPVLAVILYFLTSVLNRGMFNRMSPFSNRYSNDFCTYICSLCRFWLMKLFFPASKMSPTYSGLQAPGQRPGGRRLRAPLRLLRP